VTEFKAHCLDMIRQVEQAGASVELTRHGRVVARVVPMMPVAQGAPSWLRLRGAGTLRATPEESVLNAAEFEALQAGGK
jgi:prevent-host-death family protein